MNYTTVIIVIVGCLFFSCVQPYQPPVEQPTSVSLTITYPERWDISIQLQVWIDGVYQSTRNLHLYAGESYQETFEVYEELKINLRVDAHLIGYDWLGSYHTVIETDEDVEIVLTSAEQLSY